MKLVKPLDVVNLSTLLRLIDYGEPGKGKTWFGASAIFEPTLCPWLFLNYRSQIGTLRKNDAYMEAMEDGRLMIVELEQYKDLNKVYKWLLNGRGSEPYFDKMMEYFGHTDVVNKDGSVTKNTTMPKGVTVDSLTELQRSEVMRRAGNKEGTFITDVQAPGIHHWGELLNQFTLLAHLFFKLPYHIVFSGLETVDYGKRMIGEQPEIVAHRLALQGQAKRQFPAYAYTLMRLEQAPRGAKMSDGTPVFNRGITTSVSSRTKEQTGFIPATVNNPTIPKLVAYLNKGVNVND